MLYFFGNHSSPSPFGPGFDEKDSYEFHTFEMQCCVDGGVVEVCALPGRSGREAGRGPRARMGDEIGERENAGCEPIC